MVALPEQLSDWLNSQTGLELAITLAAWVSLAALLWRVAKVVWPGLNSLVLFINSLGKLPAFMKATECFMESSERRLEQVRHEVLPNEGGSMRDDLETATLMIQKLSEEVTMLKDHDSADHKRISQLEDTIVRRREVRTQRHPEHGGQLDLPGSPAPE